MGLLDRLGTRPENGDGVWIVIWRLQLAGRFRRSQILGIVNPLVEVYVAGCFGGVPLILTQTVMVSPRRKARPGLLDSIPEERGDRENGRSDGLVCQRTMASLLTEGSSDDGYDSNAKATPTYYPGGWYMDEDGQLSWFNAGVRVGVGIGLGMCVGNGDPSFTELREMLEYVYNVKEWEESIVPTVKGSFLVEFSSHDFLKKVVSSQFVDMGSFGGSFAK
ncbi:uncharacterized protein A4U43_C01F16320 [Asparagus officinalis]|uniref:Uncharacterized protein n=1 Tax=Asparagus officinalis TaxID=4686 RepID=A0A5P1FSA6_ASPOF|nr:uncharacterized protein A4U43_C01F16320 [Asparagus officinalis]